MTPIIFTAIVSFLGVGHRIWKKTGIAEYRQALEQAFTRLLADDAQHVVPAKQLPISRTALNLTALRLRENRSEILAFADLIFSRGYTRTAKALRDSANQLEK